MSDTRTTRASRGIPSPVLAIVLVILTLVAYLPVIRGGFVWDDRSLITPFGTTTVGEELHQIWCTTERLDFFPMTESLWCLEWRVWGDHATGYHVVNLLLHAANALLLWAVLRRLRVPGAWLAALVFAIHPVNVATAAWISEQKNTLSMFFALAAVLLYLKYDDGGGGERYGASLAAFLVALLSKSGVVMLPVVLLGCIWWRRGNLRVRDVLRCGPYFGLSLAIGLVTIWFQHHRAMAGLLVRQRGFGERLAGAGCMPWFYLCKVLAPWDLMAIYPQWHIDGSRWTSYVPGVMLVGSFALFWWRRGTWGRPLLLGWGSFVVMLAPVLGLIGQSFHRYSLVADHWQYYSIAGVIALVVAGGEKVFVTGKSRGREYAGIAVAVVVVSLLGAATWRRSGLYADDRRLWEDNVARNPDAWMAQSNLAMHLVDAGRVDEAIGHYRKALAVNPEAAEAHVDLGVALIAAGRESEAVGEFEQAIRIKPDLAGAHVNLGLLLVRAGKTEEAIGQFEEAVRIDPEYAEGQEELGNALLMTGRASEAVGHFAQAVRVNPEDDQAQIGLGSALTMTGRAGEAIGHFEQALRIHPGDATTHYNLGVALAKVGRVREAIGEYEEALKLKPDLAAARAALNRLRAVQ
ncbi:MAG TPA: tetratricopeptide repeat protein [Verrucomicrobiae bacterium]|nr:tetratricopeptide repeat protein [Verrucomicrobiae bacterium]